MMPSTSDRTILRTEAYPDGRNLAARASIYRYRQPPLDLAAAVLAELPAQRGLVVDVGCGNGMYTTRLRAQRPGLDVLGLDLSVGMAGTVGAPAAVADATRLPLPDGVAAGVICAHMLYHVPDPAAAVAELARVRAADGTVLITTNAADDKTEITALWRAAAARATGTDHEIPDVTEHCDLDRAQQLAEAVFAQVRRIDLAGEVVVPEPGPVLAFLNSQRSITGRGLPVDEVLAAAGELVTDTIGAAGAYRFGTHVGILVCH
jgi:SAM-dependent methyltransferase